MWHLTVKRIKVSVAEKTPSQSIFVFPDYFTYKAIYPRLRGWGKELIRYSAGFVGAPDLISSFQRDVSTSEGGPQTKINEIVLSFWGEK